MTNLETKFKKLFPHLNYEDFKDSDLWICIDEEVIYDDNQIEIEKDPQFLFNDNPGPVG